MQHARPPFVGVRGGGVGVGAELELFQQRIFRNKKALQDSGRFPQGPLKLRAPQGGFTKSLGPKPLTNCGGEVAGKMEAARPPSQPRAFLPTRARHSLCARQSRAHLSVSQPRERPGGRGGAKARSHTIHWSAGGETPRRRETGSAPDPGERRRRRHSLRRW